MNFKYGKYIAFGLLLLTIAGCSKQPETIQEDEFKANRERQQRNEQEQRPSQ